MGIKTRNRSFPILDVLGRVGWLDDSVIKNDEDAYLFPCGWTHCNMRLSFQDRDSRHFPSTNPEFPKKQTSARFQMKKTIEELALRH